MAAEITGSARKPAYDQGLCRSPFSASMNCTLSAVWLSPLIRSGFFTFLRTFHRCPYEIDRESRRCSLDDCYRGGTKLTFRGKETMRRHVHIEDALMDGPKPGVTEATPPPLCQIPVDPIPANSTSRRNSLSSVESVGVSGISRPWASPYVFCISHMYAIMPLKLSAHLVGRLTMPLLHLLIVLLSRLLFRD